MAQEDKAGSNVKCPFKLKSDAILRRSVRLIQTDHKLSFRLCGFNKSEILEKHTLSSGYYLQIMVPRTIEYYCQIFLCVQGASYLL